MISKIVNKVKWLIIQKKFKECGTNTSVGMFFFIRCPECISIGNEFHAGKSLTIEAWKSYANTLKKFKPHIKIGNEVSVMDNCQISCCSQVIIGNGVLLGNNVFITDNFHGSIDKYEIDIPPAKRKLYVKGNVKVEDNVWIGRNVCIMPNVVIGEGSIIGANAVVTENIPPYSVAVGVPAKVIKKLKG